MLKMRWFFEFLVKSCKSRIKLEKISTKKVISYRFNWVKDIEWILSSDDHQKLSIYTWKIDPLKVSCFGFDRVILNAKSFSKYYKVWGESVNEF